MKVGTAAKLATGQRARQFKGRGYTVQRERGEGAVPVAAMIPTGAITKV